MSAPGGGVMQASHQDQLQRRRHSDTHVNANANAGFEQISHQLLDGLSRRRLMQACPQGQLSTGQ